MSFTERLWRRLLLDPNVRAAPFAIDLSRRPVTATMVAPRPKDPVRLGALGCLLAVAAFFSLMAALDGQWVVGVLASVLFAIALVIGAVVRRAGRMHWRATWHADRVDVQDVRWGKDRSGTFALAGYEAVRLRSILVTSPSVLAVRPSYTLHLAELRHPDPLRTLLLASHRSIDVARQAGEGAAAALALPLVDASG